MTAEIIYLHQKRNIDPVLTAYEELKNLEIILSSLPDGDEADVIICRIRECEVRIISWQAQSHSGLVAQLGLLRSWENEGTAPSRSFIVAGGKLVTIFIRDWARRLAGWIDGIAMIAQARRTRARYRRPRAHQRVILPRVYRHRGRKTPPLSWRYRGPSRSTLQPLDQGVQDHEVPPNRSDQVGRVPGEPSTPEIYDSPQPTPSCRLPFAVAGRHLPLSMPSKGASMASDLPGIWRMSNDYLGIAEFRLGGAVKGYRYQISQ